MLILGVYSGVLLLGVYSRVLAEELTGAENVGEANRERNDAKEASADGVGLPTGGESAEEIRGTGSDGTPRIVFSGAITLYQRFISPHDDPSCVFSPTCSTYAQEAIERYGLEGVFMGIDRLTRCNPFALRTGLYDVDSDGKLIDPVPRRTK